MRSSASTPLEQLDVFRDRGPRVTAPVAPLSIAQRFEQFHAANPQVYRRLVDMTRSAKAAGAEHIGIAMIFEELRWQATLRTIGSEFKLNNDFRAYYARRIMSCERDLRGVFGLRSVDEDGA